MLSTERAAVCGARAGGSGTGTGARNAALERSTRAADSGRPSVRVDAGRASDAVATTVVGCAAMRLGDEDGCDGGHDSAGHLRSQPEAIGSGIAQQQLQTDSASSAQQQTDCG
ncbi:MAG TPA: hypothetical protein VHN77_02270 [Phycisphaerales bacterium]|nr:hypothetical protein [Phycisphaerales bacterium]